MSRVAMAIGAIVVVTLLAGLTDLALTAPLSPVARQVASASEAGHQAPLPHVATGGSPVVLEPRVPGGARLAPPAPTSAASTSAPRRPSRRSQLKRSERSAGSDAVTPPAPHPSTALWLDLKDTVTGLGNDFLFGESCPVDSVSSISAGCFLAADTQSSPNTSGPGQVLFAPLNPGKGTLAAPWKLVASAPSGAYLTDMSCTSTGSTVQCFAVGSGGLILYCSTSVGTCDAGAKWGRVPAGLVPTNADLYGVSCNDLGCAAVGNNGTIITTSTPITPSTSVWVLRHAVSPGDPFLSVVCHDRRVDPTDACFAGGGTGASPTSPMISLGAVTGVLAWTDSASVPKTAGFVNGMACEDRNSATGNSAFTECYAAADNRMLATTNGGATWQVLGSAPGALSVSCSDTADGCTAVGYSGQIMQNSPGDRTTWTRQDIPGVTTEFDMVRCSFNSNGITSADFCHAGGLNGLYGSRTQDTGQALDAYANAVIADAPFNYYRLNEPSGPLAFDSECCPAPGTYTGTPVYDQAGPHPVIPTGAVTLSPGSAVNTAGFGTAAAFTVEAWVNLPLGSASSADAIVGGNFTSQSIDFNGGHISLFDGSAYVTNVTADPEPGGAWAHYVFERSAVACGGSGQPLTNITIYRNDSQIGRGCWSGSFNVGAIGRNGGSGAFNGQIGEVALYQSLLSFDRVTAHYTAGGRPAPAVVEFLTPHGAPFGVINNPGDGNSVWFGEQTGGYLGRIDSAGVMTEFPLPAGAQPTSLTSDPSGDVWVADSGTDRAYLVSHSSGAVLRSFQFAPSSSPRGVALSTAVNKLYVTLYSAGTIEIVDLATNAVTAEPFGSPPHFINPFMDTIGPDGNLWFTDFNSSIGEVTTDSSHTYSDYIVGGGPLFIIPGNTSTSVFYGDSTGHNFVRFNTTTHATTSTALGCAPNGVAIDYLTNPWAACSTGQVVRASDLHTVTVPSASPSLQGMASSGNYLWVAENNTNRIARVSAQ